MERVHALINKLESQAAQQGISGELLETLHALKAELSAQLPAADHTKAPITVIPPKGMEGRFSGNGEAQPAISTATATVAEAATAPPPQASPVLGYVPRPPAVIRVQDPEPEDTKVAEPISEPAQEQTNSQQAEISVKLPAVESPAEPTASAPEEIVASIPESTPDKAKSVQNFTTDPAPAPAADEPIVLTLDVTESWEKEIDQLQSKGIPPGFLNSQSEVAKASERARELHEILAERQASQPAGYASNGKAERVETVQLPRITDLRKGISINDRYQYITNLFRGDQDMFERSIRTLNNFAVLQEARYWMQRELVTKLGWNEEDELVLQFYDLINRRFA